MAKANNPRIKKFSPPEKFSGTSSRISGNRWRTTNITRKGKPGTKMKTPMKRNLNKFAAYLLFAFMAIICSLTMWGSPPVNGKEQGIGKTTAVIEREPANPLGTTGPSIAPPFDSNYSLVSVGSPAGVVQMLLRWSYVQV